MAKINVIKEAGLNLTLTTDVTVALGKTLEFTCDVTGISQDLIKGESRLREIVSARHLYCFLCKRYFSSKISLGAIGAFINRDHATVIHAVRKVSNHYATDRTFAAYIDDVLNSFESDNHLRLFKKSINPSNGTFKRERERCGVYERKSNEMYYQALKTMEEIKRQVEEDLIIEGFRKAKLLEYLQTAKNELNEIKSIY